MKRLISIILIVALPIYILLFSLEINTFNLKMFERHFEENEIEQVTGKDKSELMEVAEDLLNYIRGKDIDLSKHFNEREVAHMVDVEKLFHYGFIIKRILFILISLSLAYLIYNRKNRGILNFSLNYIYRGLFIDWFLVVLFFILAMMDFTKYFTYFHLIFFDNDLWLLNPKTDLMIQMLPEIFFTKIFIRIIVLFLVILFLIHFIVYRLKKKLDPMED